MTACYKELCFRSIKAEKMDVRRATEANKPIKITLNELIINRGGKKTFTGFNDKRQKRQLIVKML